MSDPQFVGLGLGRFVRVDRIIAIEPIEGEQRGSGRRTLVWVEGLPEPMVASRSDQAIMGDLLPAVEEEDLRDEGTQISRRAFGDRGKPPLF